MITYFFDLNGTLTGNVGGLADDLCADLLTRLGERDRVVVWTDLDLDYVLARWFWVADALMHKKISLLINDPNRRDIVVVDDDEAFLRLCVRWEIKAIHASDMGLWHQTGAEPAPWKPLPVAA